MTFDYQFQTFGEKQQKCYCGSEKCRGFLGTSNSSSSNNNLDQLWNDSDSDSDEENDSGSDDEENEEDSSDNNNNKSFKRLDDLDVSSTVASGG